MRQANRSGRAKQEPRDTRNPEEIEDDCFSSPSFKARPACSGSEVALYRNFARRIHSWASGSIRTDYTGGAKYTGTKHTDRAAANIVA